MSSAVWLGSFSSCVAHDLPLPPTSCSAARELVDEEIAEMDGYFFLVASSSVAMRYMSAKEASHDGSERQYSIYSF